MATEVEIIWKEYTKEFPGEVTEQWWAKIVEKLTDGSRKYHNLEHLASKMSHFEAIKSHLKNPQAVALALCFNYFDYDPQAGDCETKNIEHFDKFTEEAGISNDSPLHQQVISLLMASATHSTEEHKTDGVYGSEDRHYFLDIDMSPLGASAESYSQYSERLREEYEFLPGSMYSNLRLRVLENFLQIPNIFATKEFREKYEQQARENISKEVDSLKS